MSKRSILGKICFLNLSFIDCPDLFGRELLDSKIFHIAIPPTSVNLLFLMIHPTILFSSDREYGFLSRRHELDVVDKLSLSADEREISSSSIFFVFANDFAGVGGFLKVIGTFLAFDPEGTGSMI